MQQSEVLAWLCPERTHGGKQLKQVQNLKWPHIVLFNGAGNFCGMIGSRFCARLRTSLQPDLLPNRRWSAQFPASARPIQKICHWHTIWPEVIQICIRCSICIFQHRCIREKGPSTPETTTIPPPTLMLCQGRGGPSAVKGHQAVPAARQWGCGPGQHLSLRWTKHDSWGCVLYPFSWKPWHPRKILRPKSSRCFSQMLGESGYKKK